MGLFSWLKGQSKETPAQQSKAFEAPSSAAAPARTTLPPKERQRALGAIGCQDISPLASASIEELRAAEAKALADGAIAGKWHSSRYYEPYGGTDHPERDHKIYTLRGNWAMQKGLMQAGPDGYVNEITAPGGETGCQCHFVYLHNLRDPKRCSLNKASPNTRSLKLSGLRRKRNTGNQR